MTAEEYKRREEEHLAWKLHRSREAAAAEKQWLDHADGHQGRRGYSDPQRVQDALVGDEVLARLQDRPTLRLGPPAPWPDWNPEEVCS